MLLVGCTTGLRLDNCYVEGDGVIDTTNEIQEYCDKQLFFQELKLKEECKEQIHESEDGGIK